MSTTAETEQKSVTEAKSEMAFVERFASALQKGETDQDRGRERQERKVAESTSKADDDEKGKKSTESKKSDKPKADKSAPGGTQEDPDDDTDDDEDEEEGDDKAKKGPDADDEDDEPDADDDDNEEDDEKEKGKKKKEGDEEDEEEVDDDDEDEASKEANSALQKHGIKLSLKDVPEKYRPVVQQQLENMKSSYSRAMAEARAYRKEEVQYRAERKFIEDNPEYAIVELLDKLGADMDDPKSLAAKVNELLATAGDDKGKKLLHIELKERRDKIMDAINKESQNNEKRLGRADQIETYLKTACAKLGLDFDLVSESAINRLLEKPEDQRDLTDKELDAIIGRHSLKRKRLLGEKRQNERKKEIQGRQRDKVATSPAARGGSGSAPTPSGNKPPSNDEEFAEHMASKLAGSRKARR